VKTVAGDRLEPLDRNSPLELLLIEDSAADRDLFEDLLEEELPHTTVTTCRTLAEARALVSTRHFDAVMADLGLPDAHGLSVVEAVRSADRSPALLVLTGRDDSSLALTALSFGAQDYLVKGRHDGGALATAVLHAVQRQRAERADHLYLQMAKGLLDAIEAPTCAVDQSGRIVTVNHAWRRLAEAAGADPDASAEGSDYLAACERGASGPGDTTAASAVAAGLRDVLAGRQVRFQAEYACHSPTRQAWFTVRISPTEIDGRTGAVICHMDVSVMHEVQQEFLHQSLHDPLTGLPNRVLLDRPARAGTGRQRPSGQRRGRGLPGPRPLQAGQRQPRPPGGRRAAAAGRRAADERRPAGDTLSRYAGDEFVVLFRDLTDPADAGLLCGRLLRRFDRPSTVGGSEVVVTASIGVVTGGLRRPSTSCCCRPTRRCTTPRPAGGAEVGSSAPSCGTTPSGDWRSRPGCAARCSPTSWCCTTNP
jgi:PleD family two-component response regulator